MLIAGGDWRRLTGSSRAEPQEAPESRASDRTPPVANNNKSANQAALL